MAWHFLEYLMYLLTHCKAAQQPSSLQEALFQIRPLLFYLNYMLLLLPPTFPRRLLHKGLCIPKDLEGTWARGLRMGLESRYFKFHTWTVCLCNFHPLLPNLTPPVAPPTPCQVMTSSQIMLHAHTCVFQYNLGSPFGVAHTHIV